MPNWEFLPASWAYGAVTQVRNKFFDWGILPSKKYDIPIIGIGNLSTGGTGKSPHTIYVVELLKDHHQVAVVSRGYGRTTHGMIVANYDSTYEEIGDEALQVFERFRKKIIVIVSEQRTKALDYAISKFNTNAAVLDDCFQHRYVNPGLKILLTAYGHLYSDDYLLPVGNLRETRSNAKRADIIVVTKCPKQISEEEKQSIKSKLKVKENQQLYFSSIEYAKKVVNRQAEIHLEELENYEVVLVTGIADAEPMVEYLKDKVKNLNHLSFKDHHRYTPKDVETIYTSLQEIKGEKLLLTTEKDFMRLQSFEIIEDYLFYLPIEILMHNAENFNSQIINYANQTT